VRPAVQAIVVATGCGYATAFVHDVKIDGYDLVVERCSTSGASCMTERVPLPVVVSRGPSREAQARLAGYRELAAARDALVACAHGSDAHVELQLDHWGQAIGARIAPADPAIAGCIVQALHGDTFPSDFAFTVRAAEPAEAP